MTFEFTLAAGTSLAAGKQAGATYGQLIDQASAPVTISPAVTASPRDPRLLSGRAAASFKEWICVDQAPDTRRWKPIWGVQEGA
jgi:hypothetical protein